MTKRFDPATVAFRLKAGKGVGTVNVINLDNDFQSDAPGAGEVRRHPQLSRRCCGCAEERGQDCPGPSWGCWPAPSAGSCAATRCPICASVIRLTGEAIRSSKRTMVRYEGDHPGELGHMEVNDRAHPRSIVVMPCPAK
jgi:hypothetical protein